jgi:hypothetical protein
MEDVMKRTITLFSTALALAGVTAPTASAQRGQLDLSSSEHRTWANLPLEGRPSRIPWVGYWWSYSNNGIASAYRPGEPSPAEKLDRALGREGALDMAALERHMTALSTTLHPLENEQSDVVKKLNQMIARGEDYQDCGSVADASNCVTGEPVCACPWNRYRELGHLIKEAQRSLPAVEIDTVTEFEHLHHGQGVAGVQDWWGHCNAWAAAAIL